MLFRSPLISCSVLLSALIALVSLKYRTRDICSIVVAAILIVFAEYFVLPFQRTHNIHDGVGLPILVFGWFLLFKVFDGGLDKRVSFKLDYKATELGRRAPYPLPFGQRAPNPERTTFNDVVL